jgi:signal peptidase I
MLLVRGLLVQSFFVPSGSMEPTIEPGDPSS